jgi:glycine/D-amino acid oxidase-like deaminating enzyme
MRLLAAGTPCWAAADAQPPRLPPLRGRLTADVAVVGAGLAGLSTAYHLADRAPWLDIAVVDAEHPAAGASGRGTGLLGPRAGPPIDKAARRHGPDAARRMHLASVEAVEQVLALCDKLGAACGLRPGEQIVAARSPAGLAALARQTDTYRALGLDIAPLSAAEMRSRLDVPRTAGLLYPTAATLDPAALSAALASACAAKGVRFHGGSPLREVRRTAATGTELAFAHGVLRADQAVLAVNSAAGPLGLPVGTVLPLEVPAVATAPLGPEAYEALGGRTGAAMLDAVPLAPYFRLLPDGGLVAGGGTALLPAGRDGRRAHAARERAWAWLVRWLRTLHPDLVSVPITHRWTGRIGMTGDDLPVVGPVAGLPGVRYIGGCCGHGLALSVAHGAWTAGALLGEADRNAALPWHRPRAPRLPTGGPAGPLLRAALGVLGRTARRTC